MGHLSLLSTDHFTGTPAPPTGNSSPLEQNNRAGTLLALAFVPAWVEECLVGSQSSSQGILKDA